MKPITKLILPLSVLTVLTASYPLRIAADIRTADVQVSPNLALAMVIFTPNQAEYAFSGKQITPAFRVMLDDEVPESAYTCEIISTDDAEKGTSAGIKPGKVTIRLSAAEQEVYYYGSTTASYTITKSANLKAENPQVMISEKNGSFDICSVSLNQKDVGTQTYSLGSLSDPNGILSDISLEGAVLHYQATGAAGSAVQTVTISTEYYQDIELKLTFQSGDGKKNELTAENVRTLRNWLTGAPEAPVPEMEIYDMNHDNLLDSKDLSFMKQAILKQKGNSDAELNPPENMPKISFENGSVTAEECTLLWNTLAMQFSKTDLSDFTLQYEPDHPLKTQIGGPCFSVFYKGIKVHAYGAPNTQSSVYAGITYTAAGRRQIAVNFGMKPEAFANLNTEIEWLSTSDAVKKNPDLNEPERIIFLDPWHNAEPCLAYRGVNASASEEIIVDAVTGALISRTALIVT